MPRRSSALRVARSAFWVAASRFRVLSSVLVARPKTRNAERATRNPRLDAANVASWIQCVLRIEFGLDRTHHTDSWARIAPDVDRAFEHRRAALDHQRCILAERCDVAPQRSERFRLGRVARRVRHAAASMRPDQWFQPFELLFKRGYQSRGCRDRRGRLQ